jgi:hypothetical protein
VNNQDFVFLCVCLCLCVFLLARLISSLACIIIDISTAVDHPDHPSSFFRVFCFGSETMDEEQVLVSNWKAAQALPISIDLIAAAKQELDLLAQVDRHPCLYGGPVLLRAIER